MAYIKRIGCLSVTVQNLIQKTSGLYYFRRGIPESLREFYKGKSEVFKSLKTRDESEAIKRCQELTIQTNAEFKSLRSTGDRDKAVAFIKSYGLAPSEATDMYIADDLDSDGHPFNQLLVDLETKYSRREVNNEREPFEQIAIDILKGEEKLTLEQILLDAKAGVTDKKKLSELERSFGYFIEPLVVTQLHLLRRKQVQGVVNKMLIRLRTGTVKKALGGVRKLVREAMLTHEIKGENPFDHIIIKGIGKDVAKKKTFTSVELKRVEEFVQERNGLPTARVIGLLVNTGARCAEIGGIELVDIHEKHKVPHISLRVTNSRGIKTSAGVRLIPLVGISLEVAKTIKKEATKGQVYAFPNWTKDGEFNDNSCNNAVNKLLKNHFAGFTSHCFRHTLNDRLKEANVRGDIIDIICGWKGDKMRDHYGQTDLLELLYKQGFDQLVKFESDRARI